MDEFLCRMLAILIVGLAIIIAQQIQSEREFRRWKKMWDEFGGQSTHFRTFAFRGVVPTIEEAFRSSEGDRYVGDIFHVGSGDTLEVVVWDGKGFAKLGITEPLKENK